MTLRNLTAAVGLALMAIATAANTSPELKASTPTVIDIAGHPVPVQPDGLYDRYRSNTPLSVIATEAPDIDLSWFETLKREKVDMGFESWSPALFYRNSRVTAVFTADLDRLRELMPPEVLEAVQPLQIWPGRGLVALTAYAYHYCDNDTYNEFALAIVTSAPGKANLGPLSLLGQTFSGEHWGYVLALPVNTELARVRGVVGYDLPKWLTDIDFEDRGDAQVVTIADAETGEADLTLQARKLERVSEKSTLATTRFTARSRDGQLTTGHAVSRNLRAASSMRADAVTLTLGTGPLSRTLESLKLGRMIRYDYVPDFQLALYASEPLDAKGR